MKGSTARSLTKAELKRLILREVPRLIKKDPEIREFILRISSERFADKSKTDDRFERLLEELKRDREENQKRWEENQKHLERLEREWHERWEENQKHLERLEREWHERWEENQKHLERLEREWNQRWEENQKHLERLEREWNQRWEENQKTINATLEEIKLLHRKYDTGIGAIGSRWGLRAEASFRDAMKGILEEHFPVKVERYLAMDEEGVVFGRPDQIELDLIIKDGLVIVAEIRSSISKGEVATFLRKVKVYEAKEGRAADRKILISPMIDKAALEFAIASGLKVYGYPEEVDIEDLQR